MADAPGTLPTGVVVRKLVFTAVGVFLLAAGITLMFQAMRAVMDVGGYCASGGPYEIRQECPGGVGLMFLGIVGGLIGLAFLVAGTFRGGPKLWVLAWPALFLSLGWNFLEYAFDPPPPDDGIVWGWLICGVLFVAMGGVPLLIVLGTAKLTLWGSDQPRDTTAATASALSRLTGAAQKRTPTFVRYGDTTVATAPVPAPAAPAPPPPSDDMPTAPGPPTTSGSGDEGLVSDLERLAALHRDGALTDAEYARAKDSRLAEEDA